MPSEVKDTTVLVCCGPLFVSLAERLAQEGGDDGED